MFPDYARRSIRSPTSLQSDRWYTRVLGWPTLIAVLCRLRPQQDTSWEAAGERAGDGSGRECRRLLGVDDVEGGPRPSGGSPGGQQCAPPMDVEGIIVATVTDPFRNVFGVIRNPHFRVDPPAWPDCEHRPIWPVRLEKRTARRGRRARGIPPDSSGTLDAVSALIRVESSRMIGPVQTDAQAVVGSWSARSFLPLDEKRSTDSPLPTAPTEGR